ncbi:MAG: transglutaminase family protein, partial [Betaproteobacteria bacterium]|nr:transglutaminase family protein [Betaproteobacteria bacterium]
MSVQIALLHRTEYRYERPLSLGPQWVRLRPAPHTRTPLISYALTIEPEGHFIHWQQDPYANYQARLVFPERTALFRVTVELIAEIEVFNPFDFFLDRYAEQFPFVYEKPLAQDLLPYSKPCALTPALAKRLDSMRSLRGPTLDCLVQFNQDLQRDILYTIRMEPGVQTPDQTLAAGKGSCRDSAWLLVCLLRHLGLAARFVSGYLIQLKPDLPSRDAASSLSGDFCDLHAWCEVFLPGAGWIGLDPTSGLLASEGHIPLACTPDPGGAAPIEGELEQGEVQFSHQMSVSRITQPPSIEKPYRDDQWQSILHLGEQVERVLVEGDVRLTMGGEPTFVSATDRESAQWHTEALGPGKRALGVDLIGQLKARYAPGGFFHFGQGKWYPGEQLPRWALSLYWRKDGVPCWPQSQWLADEKSGHLRHHDDAERFAKRLAKTLGLQSACVIPAYEDVFYYLWREGRLPVDEDPLNARLTEPFERARLRRVFQSSLHEVVGYVLPLHPHNGHWYASSWTLRDERLHLLPGDSPIGYRLPLESLPAASRSDPLASLPVDPYSPTLESALPRFQSMLAQPGSSEDADPQSANNRSFTQAEDSKPLPLARTALCVELRNPGRASGPEAELAREGDSVLYVFMPPAQRLEDYLSLLAAVHHTAETLSMAVVLEGYPPPKDPRLEMLQITPDPGVLEVNVQPASSWKSLVDQTHFLYETAADCGLSVEKFMLDGRQIGTGGGSHVVLGGASVQDSPFLRRPDVLASLISFWHNHPSLSYLFSGLFIGPGSQAPRIDEARNDQVYELEIALQQIELEQARSGQCPPWFIDRCLRHLLIDVTGNTHRSEFCIDKLYAPDGPNGRLGLLEMRAFEMPPHPQMSLVQQLLVRACVAWFWHKPYRSARAQRLTRWGTGLHDRFLLPSFVKLDFEDALAELGQGGFHFDIDWFAPQFAFRFPMIGALDLRGVGIELRHALEPWQLLGEEASAGGTARYVDSSLERIEVLARGLDTNR